MNTTFIIALLILVFFIICAFIVILSGSPGFARTRCFKYLWWVTVPYMYTFEHKQWKLFRLAINNIDEIEYDGWNNINCKSSVVGLYKFKFRDYRIYIWDHSKGKPLCASIHNDKECLACSFDIYNSKLLAKMLLKKFEIDVNI